MSILYFFLYILVHPYLALWWKSFPHAGRSSWEALVPGYNYFVAFRIYCQKPLWSLLLIFPGIHLVMLAVLNVSYIRRFGYYSLADTLQGIFFPYVIFAKIANANKDILPETNWANAKETEERKWGDHLVLFMSLPIIGHVVALAIGAITREKPGKKSTVKEWGDSIIFALVAASIIRTYVFEPFQIPTGSMEKTLLVGDFLFVNKLAYGPKVPVTPLSYPLVHNTVPFVNIRSYTTLEKGTYTRLPGFSHVNRYDVVVFNYPSGDTAVYDPRMPNGLMGHDYHGIVINEAKRLFWEQFAQDMNSLSIQIADSIRKSNPGMSYDERELMGYSYNEAFYKIKEKNAYRFITEMEQWKNEARKMLAEDKIAWDNSEQRIIKHYGLIYRPVDKRENYIKRCVGIPGDWLEIKNSVLYVNGKPGFIPPFQNLQYTVENIILPNRTVMYERFGLEEWRGDYNTRNNGETYVMNLTKSEKQKLKESFPDAKFTLNLDPQYSDNSSYTPTALDYMNNLDIFPKDLYVNNTTTDFTKFQVPKKGQTIKINKDNIAWYRRIITAYEGHKLEEKKDGIYIDGKKTSTYTFAMNYYWLMGDNRYNSADSRVWGFVPEDHVVGRASLVWFSKSADVGIRWERLFSVIR
jgi:signal peptidase I